MAAGPATPSVLAPTEPEPLTAREGAMPSIALSEAVAPVDPADIAASTEPVVGPAIKPVVIGSDPVVAERKRGWWRR
jgi:hypothetical protein